MATLYHTVATDLDGTLLNKEHQVSDINAAALRVLHSAGVRVILCTGRSAATALPHQRTLGFDSHVICFNGACALAPAGTSGNRDIVCADYLPTDVALRVFALAERFNMTVNVYINELVYARRATSAHASLLDRYGALTGCQYEFIDSYDRFADVPLFKLLVLTGEPPLRDDFFSAARAAFSDEEAHLIRGEYFVEFLKPGSNKAHMLRRLMDHLGADTKGVVAFGDGENDREFLSEAGLGIAVANATRVAKEAASRVSEWEHHEDAVAKELARLFPDALHTHAEGRDASSETA